MYCVNIPCKKKTLFKILAFNLGSNLDRRHWRGLHNYLNHKAYVEKRKISYFGLALNLFQHLISPNQDDLSYSARTFISGLQNGWAAKPPLFGLRRRPERTFL